MIGLYQDGIGGPLLYLVGNNYYDASTLLPRLPSVNQQYGIEEDISDLQFISEPVYIETENATAIISTTENGDIVVASQHYPDEAFEEPINVLLPFRVPDITQINPDQSYNRLPELPLPSFNQALGLSLTAQEAVSLDNMASGGIFRILNRGNSQPPRPQPISSPRSQPISSPRPQLSVDTLYLESYQTLLKQLYGLPVELPEFLIINGLRSNFIPFQQITAMFSNNEIERYIVDPMLQPWAGPPATNNRIITLFGRNGITYLVKARYDLKTNQIFPPV